MQLEHVPVLVVRHGIEQVVAGVLDDLIDGDDLALHAIQEPRCELVTPGIDTGQGPYAHHKRV